MKNDNSTKQSNASKPMLGDASFTDLDFSVIQNIQNDFVIKASKDFDNHLKNYVTKNLKELGFEFENETDFIDFVSNRVTRVGFAYKPNEYELYVDFQSKNQKLIGLYNDKISFSNDGSTFTATFGRSIT